jgi:hypothetical protein
MESPETLHRLEAIGDLNIRLCCMTKERTEEEEREEGAEPESVYRPQLTPPPWSSHFSNHSLCTSLGTERLKTADALTVSKPTERT